MGKTTRAVAEMIAARFPKPDVHACIEPLAPQPALPVASTEMPPAGEVALPAAGAAAGAAAAAALTQIRPRIDPLSASRYRVELTVASETKAKLERIQDLMRHRNPSGDLEKIVEASLDLLLTKLEKERLGKTTRSRVKSPTAKKDGDDTTGNSRPKTAWRGYIARAVQREVWARDAEQCTYVDAAGSRCPARGFLELDHIDAKALGGSDEAANLRLRCRVHNRLHAEHVFGRGHIEERIDLRQRKYAASGEAPRKVAASGHAPSFETAARGLRFLGFREPEVREVIARLGKSLAPETCVETIVRDALGLLT